MGKIGKRILAILLVLAAVAAFWCPAVSADYENTYSNTGDMRSDIIGVALTQVGYTEGPNNDTKYGDWMNLSNHPWCGIFVSWCARQAGVPTSVMANTGIANPSNFGLKYYTIDEYTPRSGDLFFKKNFSHVGFVYSVGSTTFTTIEGNTGNSASGDGWAVMVQTRTLSDYYFATPNYPTDSHHNYEQHYEDKHPHKEYYQCTDCPSNYYSGNTVYVDSCKTCVQEKCSHTYGDWTKTSASKHARTCTKCDKQETDNHDWKTTEVTKEATCKETGSQEQTCTVCKAERLDSIPKTDDHDFGDWKYISDLVHQRVCDFCGFKDNKPHDIPEDTQVEPDEESIWESNEKEHWLLCETCGEKIGQDEHDFGTDCVAPCQVCAYVREEGHFFGGDASFDEEEHWFQCRQCQEESNREPHEFEFDCSEICQGCGFTREVEHSYTEEFCSDKKAHWYECTVCGKIQGLEDHLPGPEATEDAPQTCTLCDYELAAKVEHVHFFGPIEFDSVTHFGTCRCGQTLGPESHMWDMASGLCSVCGYAAPSSQIQQQNWDFIWYIAVGVLAAATLTVILIITHRKRKNA